MTSINLFIVIATLIILFMGIIWSNSGWVNILCKMTAILMMVNDWNLSQMDQTKRIR